MSDQEPANDGEARFVTVRLQPLRAAVLARLADDLERDAVDLATKLLENEIGAQYGLRHGPILKRFMYR